MDVKLEYLQHDDLQGYKILLDDALGESVELAQMQASYKEDHHYLKTVVVKKGSEIIGTITFALIDSFTGAGDPRIEFFNFATSPSARGTATATMLMDFVTDYAREHGYKSVAVNCSPTAERAHNFYAKMGLQRVDNARFVLDSV